MNIIWRHRKTDKDYTIVNFALDEATLLPLVVYRSLGPGNSPIWARPATEFFDGRFEQIIDNPESLKASEQKG